MKHTAQDVQTLRRMVIASRDNNLTPARLQQWCLDLAPLVREYESARWLLDNYARWTVDRLTGIVTGSLSWPWAIREIANVLADLGRDHGTAFDIETAATQEQRHAMALRVAERLLASAMTRKTKDSMERP